jgi:N,N-dimethylformamidase
VTVILGYASRRSLRAGESIDFKVSVEGGDTYDAQVVRLYAPDVGPAPHMPQFRADPVKAAVNGSHPGREQKLKPGSYVEVPGCSAFADAASSTVSMRIYPTLITARGHALFSTLWATGGAGIEIGLDAGGVLVVSSGGATWSSGLKPRVDMWNALSVSLSPQSNEVAATILPLPGHRIEDVAAAHATGTLAFSASSIGPLRFGAARGADGGAARAYNGKLERIRWLEGWADDTRREAMCRTSPEVAPGAPARGDWDFSQRIDSEEAIDFSGNWRHGKVVHMPARGVTGSLWDTSALDWRGKPSHYGAIHFHDDDMIDAGWETDFTLDVARDWPSGAYAVHLTAGEAEYFVPFFVRPPAGERQSDAVFLVPTCTYAAYANLRVRIVGQWNELIHGRLTVLDATDLLLLDHSLGLSNYDGHSDGSTVLYSGMDRPVTNFRPNGRIYKFCQDMMLIAWAHQAGFDLDMVTDEDLHLEGQAALAGYRTVVTGSHPEYWSTPMLDALEGWLRKGGRMMYLGGNGFFWRTAYHPTRPSVVEVRRIGMEQIWSEGSGEAIFSTVPEPGGTWLHAGRAPNLIAGVGFITQGFDANSYYRKRPDAADPRAAFVFEGVPEDLIGDFGALMGGAAGYEIDRHDVGLGSPSHSLVLASSEKHSNLYDLMVGSVVDVLPSSDPNAPDALRADMVFFETPGGGAVFSVGSIAWCGSLSWNGYDNNVAKITANVLRRFNDPAPFEMPAA